MNCFIETLSYIHKNLDLERFKTLSFVVPERETPFEGRQTNEAPSKYLMWSLAKEGKLFDKIRILVTDECIGDDFRIGALENRTTYEYYVDEMKKYIRKLSEEFSAIQELIDNRYNGSVDDYVASVFKYVVVPSNPSREQSKAIVESVISGDEVDDEDIKLSLDFTGGSRVASLISLLIVRILEITNAKLDKVVYANILNKPFEIVNLIESYNLLQSVENIAKAQSIGSNKGIVEELHKMQLATEGDVQAAGKLDMKAEIASGNFEKMSVDKQKAEKKELDAYSENSVGLAKKQLKTGAEQVAKINKTSPFEKLTKNNGVDKNDRTIIVDFYETLIGILCDLNIIIYTKSDLKDKEKQKDAIQKAIQANDSYYIRYNKRGIPSEGVILRVREWLRWLDKNRQFFPVKNFEHKIKIVNRDYDYAGNKYFVKGVNSTLSDVFLAYIEKNNIVINSQSALDSFKKYERLQRIYFNCGFPFMCVSVKNSDIYPEIMDYYLDKTSELMASLEELKKTDEECYLRELKKLIADEAYLTQNIPYMIEMSLWYVNPKKFQSDTACEDFIKSLCKRIEEVRPYRNAVSHNLRNAYSDREAMRNIANKIKNWTQEYKDMFSDEE